MNRHTALGSLAILIVSVASPATAAPLLLLGSASGSWHAFMDETESRGAPGTPYWDGNSWDSHSTADDPTAPFNPAGALALLEGHVAVSWKGDPISLAEPAPGHVEFWARPDLGADHAITLADADGAATYRVKLLAEVTALPNNNEFGWYSPGAPDDLHPLLLGADGPGVTWTGVLPEVFGLYMRDAARGVLYRSEADGAEQQIAFFRLGPVLYLGVEDLAGLYPTQSDYDYNDMVISLQQVPEPVFLPALGIGLAALARAAFLRRARA